MDTSMIEQINGVMLDYDLMGRSTSLNDRSKVSEFLVHQEAREAKVKMGQLREQCSL